jgi:inner membrane protein
MPSLLGHAVAGLALNAAFAGEEMPRRSWALTTFCALAPDLDWFSAFLNLPHSGWLDHRGITHSLPVAALLAGAMWWLGFKRGQRTQRLLLCLMVAAFSHGLLDACTKGGVGVAAFLPFSKARYVCLWQPLQASPLPLNGALALRFLRSLFSELLWIGLPAWLLVLAAREWKRPTFGALGFAPELLEESTEPAESATL